jgi:hypothetical protein
VITLEAEGAPSTMLRMVPLPRFAGEDLGRGRPQRRIFPRSRGRGTAEGGGGGANGQFGTRVARQVIKRGAREYNHAP